MTFPFALYDLPPPFGGPTPETPDADGIAHWGELWIHHGGFVPTCGNATENLPRPLKQCAAWVKAMRAGV